MFGAAATATSICELEKGSLTISSDFEAPILFDMGPTGTMLGESE